MERKSRGYKSADNEKGEPNPAKSSNVALRAASKQSDTSATHILRRECVLKWKRLRQNNGCFHVLSFEKNRIFFFLRVVGEAGSSFLFRLFSLFSFIRYFAWTSAFSFLIHGQRRRELLFNKERYSRLNAAFLSNLSAAWRFIVLKKPTCVGKKLKSRFFFLFFRHTFAYVTRISTRPSSTYSFFFFCICVRVVAFFFVVVVVVVDRHLIFTRCLYS